MSEWISVGVGQSHFNALNNLFGFFTTIFLFCFHLIVGQHHLLGLLVIFFEFCFQIVSSWLEPTYNTHTLLWDRYNKTKCNKLVLFKYLQHILLFSFFIFWKVMVCTGVAISITCGRTIIKTQHVCNLRWPFKCIWSLSPLMNKFRKVTQVTFLKDLFENWNFSYFSLRF